MGFDTIQDILKVVEQPSRYIGSEINSIKKDHDKTDLKIALAFPDLYDIGTSHFGMQILYNILNNNDNIVAERVFAPAIDMENQLRVNHIDIFTLESNLSVNKFDIIGFSLLYELNYTNILTILDLAGIPFLSSERNETHPLIIAGGPSTFNPEPVADIFDAIVIGDGENVITEISDIYIQLKNKSNRIDRQDLLKKWSRVRGVYIPSFFVPEYKTKQNLSFQTLKPVFEDYKTVKKAIIPDLEKGEFPHSPVIPFGRPVHDRLRLEISRGCSRGCRFCQAGMIYRPVRERNVETLLEITKKAVVNTGYEDVSLLSLSTGDYENLNCLMLRIMKDNKNLSFSLPSVRAGKLNSELMETIKKVRKTGFTIAPEAGTQRLRDVINKGLSEEDIINTVKSAFELGWKNIKLYFMIGLPTETEDDLHGIIDIVHKLKKIKQSKGKRAQINVGVSTFIPKPHTPFQWESQISKEESWEKILWLKDRLKIPGVSFKWGKTNISFLEGIMSRGDRRITPLIINAYLKGCRFDGWNEHFKMDLWEQAIQEESIEPYLYSERKRDLDEALPWDHIDSGISKDFLLDELDKSNNHILTEDCRSGICSNCGICDFEDLKPVIEDKHDELQIRENEKSFEDANYLKLKLSYFKQDNAKFFGHLELVNIFTKAINRVGIPVKYTMGFHKKIKIVFNNPLPLGYESLDEFFIIEVNDKFDTTNILNELNLHLPVGLQIKNIDVARSKTDIQEKLNKEYLIHIKSFNFCKESINDFLQKNTIPIEKTSKKGLKRILNLKEFVDSVDIAETGKIILKMKNINGLTIRPEDALKHIFNIDDRLMKTADIIKIKSY